MIIIDVLHIIILIYFSLAALYFFVFAIAGNFRHRLEIKKAEKYNKIAILIPAYREDNVILTTTEKALELNYPDNLFDVFVAADHLSPTTIERLNKTKAHIIELNLSQSSKAAALTTVIRRIDENIYDIAIVFDADNQAEKDFLLKINDAFESGNKIIQAHRTAKNLNTDFAVLDAISEEVNNHLFRKAHRVLGLPAQLIGSGMAFPFKLFKELIAFAKTSFEDKEIEFMLLEKGYDIEYLEDTYIYDEKIQSSKAFSRQRTRWVYSQIYFFRQYFLKSFPAFLQKNRLGLAFRSFSTALPPRIIQLVFPFIFLIINILLNNTHLLFFWILTFSISLMTLLISIPLRFYNRKTFKALISLPMAFLLMLKAIIFAHQAKKGFIHTGHTGA